MLFSILVVAVDPSYFNNNQQALHGNAGLAVCVVGRVAGWLRRVVQAAMTKLNLKKNH